MRLRRKYKIKSHSGKLEWEGYTIENFTHYPFGVCRTEGGWYANVLINKKKVYKRIEPLGHASHALRDGVHLLGDTDDKLLLTYNKDQKAYVWLCNESKTYLSALDAYNADSSELPPFTTTLSARVVRTKLPIEKAMLSDDPDRDVVFCLPPESLNKMVHQPAQSLAKTLGYSSSVQVGIHLRL